MRFPIPTQNQEMVRYFRDLIESGRFRPVIDRRYPLDQIVEAYRYVETGQKVGNVVITRRAAELTGPYPPPLRSTLMVPAKLSIRAFSLLSEKLG